MYESPFLDLAVNRSAPLFQYQWQSHGYPVVNGRTYGYVVRRPRDDEFNAEVAAEIALGDRIKHEQTPFASRLDEYVYSTPYLEAPLQEPPDSETPVVFQSWHDENIPHRVGPILRTIRFKNGPPLRRYGPRPTPEYLDFYDQDGYGPRAIYTRRKDGVSAEHFSWAGHVDGLLAILHGYDTIGPYWSRPRAIRVKYPGDDGWLDEKRVQVLDRLVIFARLTPDGWALRIPSEWDLDITWRSYVRSRVRDAGR